MSIVARGSRALRAAATPAMTLRCAATEAVEHGSSGCRSAGDDPDRKRLEAPDHVVQMPDRFTDLERLHPLDQCLEHRAALDPSQCLAGAAVQPEAEAEMLQTPGA